VTLYGEAKPRYELPQAGLDALATSLEDTAASRGQTDGGEGVAFIGRLGRVGAPARGWTPDTSATRVVRSGPRDLHLKRIAVPQTFVG